MKTILILLCFLILIIPNDSQFLPKIKDSLKNIASNFGIGTKPTTSTPYVNQNQNYNSNNVQIMPINNNAKPYEQNNENVNKNEHNAGTATSRNNQNNGQINSMNELPQSNVEKNSYSIDLKSIDSVNKNKQTGPQTNNFPSGPQKFPQGPTGVVKNNVTSISDDGTVIFPHDEHKPNAVKIEKKNDCIKGKEYPKDHPCGKTLASTAVSCPPGTTDDGSGTCAETGF